MFHIVHKYNTCFILKVAFFLYPYFFALFETIKCFKLLEVKWISKNEGSLKEYFKLSKYISNS